MNRVILPPGWPRPKGYANAVLAEGRVLFIAGQIGWTADEVFESDDLVAQLRQALRNIRACLEAADARPEHLVRVTWYLVDKQDYVSRLAEIGQVWREELGRVFPAMTAIQVTALIEDRAKVEVEATAVIPNPSSHRGGDDRP